MFRFFLYKLGQLMVHLLPLRVAYAVGQFLSDCHYCLSAEDRRCVTNNLQALGVSLKDIPLVTREVFRNFGRYLVEFFRMRKTVTPKYLKEQIKVEHFERFEEVASRGKGGILLTAHIGNWELGAAVMSSLGYQFTAIALPHKERTVNNFFNQQREAWGIRIVPMQHAVRKCLEALRQNQWVGLLADRDFSSNGETMTFLGKKSLIPKGAAVLSAKTGAAILPAFFIRNAQEGFTLLIDQPIYPPTVFQDNVPDNIVLDLMQKYKGVIEDVIRRYPAQWLMFREFWIK